MTRSSYRSSSSVEMDIDWTQSLRRLEIDPQAHAHFADLPNQSFDRALVISALAAYVRSLVSGTSAFDRYYFGGDEEGFSEEAKEGLNLFVRKGRCATCHLLDGHSALLTDNSFHSVGIGFANGGYKDLGRFEVTGQDAHRGLFKTPSLRNVALRQYFMHDGSMRSLREVLDYYNRGGNRGAFNLDPRIKPLAFTGAEIEKLLAFLQSLSAPIVSYRPKL